ncbi:unnamed protein product [Oppiella nova]|uniref:Metalloendopeptidase n=1 Tax=Oppiella nova TaxID=334625 RepID=A0A7R9LWX2_9ACAR|nr:unnamed protein product [Oppiella nova]CAG2167693.1 unnamed protein product [Oppiella nova]
MRPIIDGYLGQVVDCFTFEGNLSKVIEVTAKSKLFYHIVSDDRIGTKLMSEVNKRHLPGEFTFIAVNKLLVKAVRYPELENNARPLTSLLKFDKRYESVMRFLFDRTLVCRSLELATTFSRSAKLDCVTIDGDFISKSGLMSGGYFGVNTRIEAFLQWKSVVANIDAILQEMSECVRRRQRNETDLISNANSMSELDVKHNETKRKFDILKDSKERSHQQLMALNAKLESIGRSISSLESTLPSMKANKESFESELELSLDSQLSESEEKELSDILRDIEVMSAKHSELCQRRNKFGSEKASLESDLDKNLEQRKNELEMTLIDAKIMESETLVENESFDLELIDKRIASLRRQSDERDAKIDEMVRQENEQKELLEKLRLAEDKQMDIINTEAKTSRQIAIKLENIEKKYNECTRKLSKMGTIPTDCDTDYQNMSLSDEYRELQKCKHKLSRLTNVNQKALDQLNEGREKARLLLVEKREIDFAYESIQRLLETLEHQKYEKIQVTYKSVSKHFIEIFKVLVPEGKAFIDMVYKDTENSAAGSQNSQESQSSGGISSSAPGQTLTFNQIDNFVGVKIRVAFTGTTVVKELNQLSGGQKSIVALAFIFAIQRCDPPPFYLFDEVDSALDPTYRKALADLIDSMSKASQFITTTFRSELLGSAHKFFGVKFRNRISHIEEISAEMAHEFVESDEARDDRNQSRRRTGTRSVRFDTTADTSAMILDDHPPSPPPDEEVHKSKTVIENRERYGGDMMGIMPQQPNQKGLARKAASANNKKWPNGNMIYRFAPNAGFSDYEKSVIQSAMKEIESVSCIQFKVRANQKDFIHIIKGQGCYSYVGRIGGSQELSLGRGCVYKGTVIHELMHAMGFYHEHMRSDRDSYLIIHLNHVMKGMNANFEKNPSHVNRLLAKFDYESIMIYSSFAFSKDGQMTMEPRDKHHRLKEPYDKTHMTQLDAQSINKMYNCPNKQAAN